MTKGLRIKISVLSGLALLLIAVIATAKVVHPDVQLFVFIADAVCAVIAMFGVYDALRKADR